MEWKDWKPQHLVDDTLADSNAEHLGMYLEWALSRYPTKDTRKTINAIYSWCYSYAELIDGISLVEFNLRFKMAVERYLKGLVRSKND